MWNGSFFKRRLTVWFDPFHVDDGTLENIDPDSDRAEGAICVQFNPFGPAYCWLGTYQDFLDWQEDNFDSSWLVARGHTGPGGWGWPYGRTKRTGFAAE